MVTASLRFAGEQLSIEIRVENREAYERLSSDGDTIVKTMRGLGSEVDRVTVMQPQAAVVAPADNGTTATGSFARDAQSFGSDSSGGSGDRTPSQDRQGNGHGSREDSRQSTPRLRDRPGDSLYI